MRPCDVGDALDCAGSRAACAEMRRYPIVLRFLPRCVPHRMSLERTIVEQSAVLLRKTWLLAARSADARKPFRPSVNGDLFDQATVYLLKIRRAEDARDLRRAVASRLGNFLLRLRRIPTGGEQDRVVPMPVTRVGAIAVNLGLFESLLPNSGFAVNLWRC